MKRTLALCCLGLAASPHEAAAAIFCVATPTQFQAALDAAENNGQTDVIRIRAGTLAAVAGGASGATYTAYLEDGRDLDISGGWLDAGCQQSSADAGATYLLPAPGRRLLEVLNYSPAAGPAPTLSVSNLTLAFVNQPDSNGCALALSSAYGAYHVALRNLRFNDHQCGSVISGAPGGGSVVIRNSLFANNSTQYPLVQFFGGAGSSAAYSAFSNNTLVGNDVAAAPSLVAINAWAGDVKHIENNVLWQNTMLLSPSGVMSQFDLTSTTAATVRNNRVQALWGPLSAASGNSVGDPGFAGVGNYRPGPSSALHDAGVANPAAGTAGTDLAGLPRVQGLRVDIGAFESEAPLFAAGFEPVVD